nr:hypothetical protein [Prauserella isguenensis]
MAAVALAVVPGVAWFGVSTAAASAAAAEPVGVATGEPAVAAAAVDGPGRGEPVAVGFPRGNTTGAGVTGPGMTGGDVTGGGATGAGVTGPGITGGGDLAQGGDSGPELDPQTEADQENAKSKLIVGLAAAALLGIIIWGRIIRRKRANKDN